MSIDMSQFYQVFFEEADELLASMESQLLALDVSSPDTDQLHSIFRAAHSIKGGSGTFGFTDMTEVTHELESLLDRIRKSEIRISTDMVDAFLEAGDVLKVLLEEHQAGSVADGKAAIDICTKLKHLAESSTVQPGKNISDTQSDGVISTVYTPPNLKIYKLSFPNTSAEFPSKSHLNSLLKDLGNTGELTNKKITSKSVSFTLTTRLSEAELRDILSFFIDPKRLLITANNQQPQESEKPTDEPFVEADGVKAEEEQEYGFFVDPEDIKSTVEDAQGYGFFVDPDDVKSTVEDAQGYGFFVDPDSVKSDVENAQGYGFFVDVELDVAPKVLNPGLRREDISGRRTTDSAAPASSADTSIRVSVAKVDQMVNLVGELVITQAMLAETISNMDPTLHEGLVSGLSQLERNTRDLQDSVLSVRMMPINLVLTRFQRVVRDNAVKLGKNVKLNIIGEGTELDKGLIEKISDPLNHLVRNSLDHGIELPEVRAAKGKDPLGVITMRAAHQSGNIVIEVSDDGVGLNRDKILAKARERGMVVGDHMSDAEVWQIIFAPGFSTADVISDVSGRGVGMDVVKRNIESIGGRIEIASEFGKGCAFTIRLPLTLAILDGLSVAVGEQTYIIPLNFISESLQPEDKDIKEISGKGLVVHVRGEYLPLIALHQLFNIQTDITRPAEGILVLLEADGKQIALFVDELLGQHQVVIKSLETNYRKVPGVSGATIMGDGRVAMIIDVASLVTLARL